MNLGEIVERDVSGARPPSAPKAPKPKTLPKSWRPARSKEPGIAPAQAPVPNSASDQPPLSESEQVHIENVKKLATMSPEEIAREREEIMQNMDPAVLAGLLKRIELKEAQESNLSSQQQQGKEPTELDGSQQRHSPLRFEMPEPQVQQEVPSQEADEDADTLHFPSPPDDLRKYFPELPVETEKMAWMQPISAEEEDEYSAELASVAPSELRFDFNGNLLTPRQSRAIDPSKGLHHHGDAPSAAGYTILELAHLARSSHSAQRSMAIQTLGRVLHKLYTGRFRKSNDLQSGLEQLVESGRVMDTLYEAAGEKTRSLTVKTHATEALWLVETVRPAPAV